MLGEKLGEFAGKATGRRVIPNDEHGPKMEICIEQIGKFLGVDATDYGTYEVVMKGNTLEGKGQGLMMTKDGETISWTGTGIGRFTGKGQAILWRGSLHYHTNSQKLARANGVCCVFEHDVDENGINCVSRVFEWK